MGLLRALVEAAGADYRQWKALTRVMLKADTRSTAFGGAQARASKEDGSGVARFRTMALMYGFFGLFLAPGAWTVADPFLSSTVVYTAVLLFVGSTILLEFQSVVIAPDDYGILAFRPVSSATYFLVKLTNVVIYTSTLAILLAAASLVTLGVRHGAAVAFAALVGLLGLSLATALGLIALYGAVLHWVPSHRLERMLSYLQLVTSLGFFALILLGQELYTSPTVAALELEPSGWTLLHPATWYAGLPALAAGQGGPFVVGGLALGAVALGGLFRLSTRRLSLSYAHRLAGRSEAPRERAGARKAPVTRGRGGWLWSRMPPEFRAVARLIRAQFRFDTKFRLAVLSVLPLSVLYLYMGLDDGRLPDPFTGSALQAAGALNLLHIAALLMPTMLMMNVGYSESAPAGWVYFATPCRAPHLLRHARTVVMMAFLVPYLVILGGLLGWFFGVWWHGAIHVVVLGLVANGALQFAQLLHPVLPFSQSPQKMQQSGRFFGTFLLMIVPLGLLGVLMAFGYGSIGGILATLGGLVVANVLGELAVSSKVSRRREGLEFTG